MERHGPVEDASVKQRLARLRNVLDQGIELKRRVVEIATNPARYDGPAGRIALAKRGNLQACEPALHRKISRRGAAAQPGGSNRAVSVVQEALANVAKHAKASNVDIAFEISDQEVILTIHDDGVGAAPTDLARPRSHGIAGMRHRVNVLGGRLDVSSGRGEARRSRSGAAAERDRGGGKRCRRLGDIRGHALGGRDRLRRVSVTRTALLQSP